MKRGSPEYEEKIEQIKAKASKYTKLFSSPDGKDVLEDLEELFFNRPSIVKGDPYATHANEGAREVVIFIRDMIKGAKNV